MIVHLNQSWSPSKSRRNFVKLLIFVAHKHVHTRSTHQYRTSVQNRIQKEYNILSYRDTIASHYLPRIERNWVFPGNQRLRYYVLNWSYLSFELTVSRQHYQLWRGVCQLETERRHRWRWPALSFFSFFFMPLFLPLLPTFFISGWWWSPSLVLPPSSLWPYLLGKKEVVRHSVSGGKHQGG